MTGFSIPTCKDELRRAIPILREHGLKKSACFCAEQLVGLAGGGMDCASPSSAAASAGVATLRALEAEPVTDAFMLASSFFELGEYARPGRARGPRRLRLRHRAQGARARAGGGGGGAPPGDGRRRRRRRRARPPAQPGRIAGAAVAAAEDAPTAEARAVLAEATLQFPWNWSAWLDLAGSAPGARGGDRPPARGRDGGRAAAAPGRRTARRPRPAARRVGALIAACHRARVAIEQQRCDEALETLARVEAVAPASTFVVAHEALAHYARRDFDRAQERFEALRAADPYRLEQLDIYSNVLYVKEARAELSRLAHAATRAEKYRPETCCVVGNYYSLKAQHERAVLYFQRALKLDRGCLSAWTLMGHEYIEMKNTAAAIEAYRRAVDVNARDYRAWYGLGQTYEILNMYFYALYYYRKAARLRPYDARMWIAIAQCHEKLHRVDDAIKGYERAAAHDDAEGHATIKLARLHRSRNDHDKAVACFQAYVDLHGQGEEIVDATAEALLYLASKHKQKADYAAAQACLARLLDYGGPEKLEAQAMLRELRSLIDTTAAPPA
ncbi:hypothetical protein JL722_13606 [Aureococcus anophagefferens]|nr:hypothetical protein JL722_13606 [Aureococcus anophagefferens]